MRRLPLSISWFVAILLLSLVLPRLLVAQEASLAELLRKQLAMENVDWAGQALDLPRLREFYASDYRPVWINGKGPTIRAGKWRWLLRIAETEGLEPERYHLPLIDQYWTANAPATRARLELLLTDAFLLYSVHVRSGWINPTEVDPSWLIDTPKVDPVRLLRKALAAKNFVAVVKSLPPSHTGYRQLRTALARYRELAKEPDWPVIPEKPKLTWGMWHDNIQLLRRRLTLSGDLQETRIAEPRFFDQGLKQAVQRFQLRHGLKADGVVGAGTRARLNTPVNEHIQQIKINMERWRWLPRKLGKRYIMVNSASFQLYVVEHDKPRLAMRVIAGTPERSTPVMSGQMSDIVLNPYWFVPTKLAVEDLLPKQLRNPDFFRANHIRVLTGVAPNAKELDPAGIDWAALTLENFPYHLRQDPGPRNSLGNIKFPFLNNMAIYLHDTPQRHLFSLNNRAFSSGCVRLEEPLQLAAYLLNGETGWDEAKLLENIVGGESIKVPLARPIPVYLVYWTVWVGADNAVYFQEDIYDRDRPINERAETVKPVLE